VNVELAPPSRASYFNQGNMTFVTEATDASVYNYRHLSCIFLSGSILLLGICLFYVLRIENEEESAEVDSIQKMTRPYAEVIATTTSLPKGEPRWSWKGGRIWSRSPVP
jgi:hypothetical protein